MLLVKELRVTTPEAVDVSVVISAGRVIVPFTIDQGAKLLLTLKRTGLTNSLIRLALRVMCD